MAVYILILICSIGLDTTELAIPAIPPLIKYSKKLIFFEFLTFLNTNLKCSLTAKQIELQTPKQTNGNKDPFQRVKTPSFFIIDYRCDVRVPLPVD